MSDGGDLAQNHKGGANRGSSPESVSQTYSAITELYSSQFVICWQERQLFEKLPMLHPELHGPTPVYASMQDGSISAYWIGTRQKEQRDS